MIIIDKWDYKTQAYLPFESPTDHLTTYSENMDEKINCANCGKLITFGIGYTSLVLHTKYGMGFPVCINCHDEEVEIEKKYR